MTRTLSVAFDLIAILVLTLAVYFPRYRRKDMVLAYIGLNVGVAAVAVALSVNQTIGTGFGLGLFGALSIIRLRSSELAHQEIAYYFAALALGLIGGIRVEPVWAGIALSAVVVAMMYVVDHPRLFGDYRQQIVVLDRAVADEAALVASLTELLGADVKHHAVLRLDTVNDTTTVDVRFRLRQRGG